MKLQLPTANTTSFRKLPLEPAVVDATEALCFGGYCSLRTRTVGYAVRALEAVARVSVLRACRWLRDPLPFPATAWLPSASVIPDHRIERASPRGARVGHEDG
jgi:hypothetical protein